MNTKVNIIKKSIFSLLGIAVGISMFAIVTKADSIFYVGYGYHGSNRVAIAYNASGQSRYVESFLMQGTSDPTSTVACEFGVIPHLEHLDAEGYIPSTMNSWSVGILYNNNHPNSGILASAQIQIP